MFYSGCVFQAEGLLDVARERYESAIEIDPDYEVALGDLAQIYLDLALLPERENLVGVISEKAKGGSDSLRRLLDFSKQQLSALTAQLVQRQARQRLISVKSSFSNLASNNIEPGNLSLIEAVYLVALFRGSEMDHVNQRLPHSIPLQSRWILH